MPNDLLQRIYNPDPEPIGAFAPDVPPWVELGFDTYADYLAAIGVAAREALEAQEARKAHAAAASTAPRPPTTLRAFIGSVAGVASVQAATPVVNLDVCKALGITPEQYLANETMAAR